MAQTLPFGKNAPNDFRGLLPEQTHALAIPAGDTLLNTIFNAGYARRIYVQTAGTLYVARIGDLDDSKALVYTPYTVAANTYYDGVWAAIGGTTRGSTSATVILEV